MGERLLDTQKAVGSIPIPPTSEVGPSGDRRLAPEGFLVPGSYFSVVPRVKELSILSTARRFKFSVTWT